MQRFLEWFNEPSNLYPLLFAGLAHLWYVTIHPFEDGNGRIARTIADMALARGENSSKWAKIAKCSQDTAGRDIKDPIERGVLKKDPGGGRSTSYSVVFDQQ